MLDMTDVKFQGLKLAADWIRDLESSDSRIHKEKVIEKAKSLTEKKRFYISKFGYEPEEVIEWWKKKASNRYETLKAEGRIRTEMEVWSGDKEIDIIR